MTRTDMASLLEAMVNNVDEKVVMESSTMISENGLASLQGFQ
jgi:hypothetical protein